MTAPIMDPRSRDFLLRSFRHLRADTKKDARTVPGADPVRSAHLVAYCDAVIASLEHDAPLPSDDALREHLEAAAAFNDEANEYETVLMEHRAWSELLKRLPDS